MILLKGFFRKKKTIIYIRIFSIIITILFLLNGINNYINRELDRINYESSSLIMFSLNNHEDLLKEESRVVSYKRILPLSKGTDNDIIYTPKLIEKEDGSIAYESIDYSKIDWNRLIYDSENYPYIFSFPASYCDIDLKDSEVILALVEDYDYRAEYKENYLNNSISLYHETKLLNLKVKNIIEPSKFNYVCISENLYTELSKQENKYIYLINAKNYQAIEELKEQWQDLEENDFYSIQNNVVYNDIETSDKKTSLSNLANMLQIATIISFIIFAIIAIFVTKDLISDEEKDILLLRKIGFNKNQIITSTLKNILLLDIIVLIISLVASLLLSILLNTLLNLSIQICSLNLLLSIIIFIILFELTFLLNSISKNNKN